MMNGGVPGERHASGMAPEVGPNPFCVLQMAEISLEFNNLEHGLHLFGG